MAVRNIVKKGDDVLAKRCREVTAFDEKLAVLLDDMQETLKVANGVGLAAPQVGVLKRVFIIDTEETGLIECVNPEILETKGKSITQEGCLSIPEFFGYVERPAIVKFKAFDRNGNEFTKVVSKLAARAVCHENDHLDGHLFDEKIIKDYEAE